MKTILLGLLLGLLAAFPHLVLPLVVEGLHSVEPLGWAFVAGLIARPRLARRIPRRNP